MHNQDYTYIAEQNLAIDNETGEVLKTISAVFPVGSRIETPKQQQRNKELRERQKQQEIRKMLYRNNNPKFTFIQAEHHYKDINPENVGRLMFLSTYLGYDSNVLLMTQKTELHKKDLPNLMNLSNTTFLRFWNDVNGKYLTENADGYVCITNDFFARGRLTKIHTEWQKLYVGAMRNLYHMLPTSGHRYIGFLFQMLPFVNIEYNILCHNPYETDIEKIIPLTLSEFCLACGYKTAEQRARLIKKYSHIQFDIDGHKELFCSFVTNLANIDDSKIYINPNVLYKGSKWDEVKILGQFCKVITTKTD